MIGDENSNIKNINIYTGEDSKVNNDCNGCSYLNHQFDALKVLVFTKIEKLEETNRQQDLKIAEQSTKILNNPL